MQRGAAAKRCNNENRPSMPCSAENNAMPNNTMRFTTTVAPDGSIRPPTDVVRALHHTRTVDVTIAFRLANSHLLRRGVSAAEIERVVAVQRLPVDVVESVLGGESSVPAHSALHTRLQRAQQPEH